MPKTPKSRIPSPARSQGPPVTPRRYPPRSSRSLASPARSSPGRPSSLADRFKEKQDSFALSPLGKSVLGDNTEIDMPRRASWWKKLDNSRDVVEVLDAERPVNQNVLEEFEVEVLTQETKNYTMDMPDSSDSESISSIVVPQRKLFTQKDNAPQKKFNQVIGNRESMAKHNKTQAEDNIELSGTKNIFKQPTKRAKPKFPSALLNISPDKTLANKTKELVAEVKGQAKSLFGNRMGAKRKNMFADFVVSESEDEIPEIQPKLFAFKNTEQQKPTTSRRSSTASRGIREPSPATSITTDIELDDWKLLPSSTMVEHQLEADLITPRKKTRLSKLSEAKESTAGNSTKQSNKSLTSKNKSKSIVEDETESRKQYSIRNNSKLNASASKRDTIAEEELKEASNVKNRTYAINKTVTKSLSQSQNVGNKDTAMNEEKAPQNVETQEEEDEEMHLTYEENDQEQDNEGGEKETLQKSVNKNQNVQSKDLESSKYNEKNESQNEQQSIKDKDFDDIESRLADIVGQGEAQIDPTETPEQDKSVHLPNKVVNETADSEVVQKDEHNEVSQNEDENLENSKEINNESQEVITSQTNSKLSNVEEENEDLEENNDEIDASAQDEAEESEQKNAEATDQEAEVSDERTEVDQELESDAEQEEENYEEPQSEQEIDEQEDERQQSEVEQSEQELEVDEQEELEVDEQEELEIDEEEELEVDEQVDEEVEHDESEQNYENEETEENEELSHNIEDQDEEEVADDIDQASDEEEQIENEEDTEQEQYKPQEESFNNEQNESQEVDEDEVIEESEEIERSNDKDTEIAQDAETNESHDTTGRNRQKRQTQSPEAILHDVTNEMDSFLAKRRNTSIRKTILKNFTIRPSMAPPRESTGVSDGSNNSSAQGSGWDSHRTTRKTLRQTFGKDFTPRKSLRALVMEKSAKQATNAANAEKLHQANSTEMEPMDNQDMDFEDHVDSVQSDHEVSKRTRQATLEMYLQKISKENMERKLKIEEQVKNSLKSNTIRLDTIGIHFALSKPTIRRPFKKPQAPKPKRKKPTIIEFEDLPPELKEDMKYKPPKRFRPSNASWITNRLYKFLEGKLEPKYDYRARVRAEKLVEDIYNFSKDLRKHKVAPPHSISALKKEMARLDIVHTHFEFYNFIREYLPFEIKIKVVPDIVNDIPLPSRGVFAPILD